MNRNSVLDEIKKIIVTNLELEINNLDDISIDMPLLNAGIDSIALMTLIVFIEDIYNIEINFDNTMMSKEYGTITFGDLENAIIQQLHE